VVSVFCTLWFYITEFYNYLDFEILNTSHVYFQCRTLHFEVYYLNMQLSYSQWGLQCTLGSYIIHAELRDK